MHDVLFLSWATIDEHFKPIDNPFTTIANILVHVIDTISRYDIVCKLYMRTFQLMLNLITEIYCYLKIKLKIYSVTNYRALSKKILYADITR